MDYIIVGTAGHVDHGKTVLVKALTGIDTDRLKEEKKRGISIELGFAPLKLPGGKKLGIVDVPGHERFIKQMLAGIGGIDIVMLVVAADEGVMPQTREHLDIIDLLGIKKGLVVITKTDLVDEEWLELVEEDVKDNLEGTVLENAPLIKVSAIKKKGLDQLISQLEKLAEETKGKSAGGRVRLPIDRSFSIAGFGTVVTGTLWSGKIATGDILQVQPDGLEARVRGLQVHGEPVDEAFAGQRVAVNLAALQVRDVPRGSVLVEKGYFKPSYRLDASLKLVKSLEKPLKNRTRVRVHLGTAENMGRIILLEKDEMKAGEEGFVQLLMEKPLVAARGDRFVIRLYSPMHTIGGGEILEPYAKKLKRFRKETIELLETKQKGSPELLVRQYLESTSEFVDAEGIAAGTDMDLKDAKAAIDQLLKEKLIKSIDIERKAYFLSSSAYIKIKNNLINELCNYHEKFHLRPGIDREELRSRLFKSWNSRHFNEFLEYLRKEEEIAVTGNYVHLPNFEAKPFQGETQEVEKLVTLFEKGGLKPPDWEEAVKQLNIDSQRAGEYQLYLQHTGMLVKLTPDIFLHRSWYEEALKRVEKHLEEKGEITIGEARDLLNSSRKYVLPLLEYLDSIKFTKRVGDKRIKVNSNS